MLIGRASTLKAVAQALEKDKIVMLASQKSSQTDEPGFDDLYEHGTIAKIVQVLRLPNNLLKVLVEGVVPARVGEVTQTEPYLESKPHPIALDVNTEDQQLMALVRHGTELFEEYVKTHRQLPPEVLSAFENLDDPVRKLYYAAANVSQKVEVKQKILQAETLQEQYVELIQMLSRDLEMVKLETEIDTKVQDQIQKSQRKYFIQEQIRALQMNLAMKMMAVQNSPH